MTTRRRARTRLEFSFPVACGSDGHEVVCEATAWGTAVVHSPCGLLPPAAQSLSRSNCGASLPRIQRCIEERLQVIWCSRTPSWMTDTLPAEARRTLDEFIDSVRACKEALAGRRRQLGSGDSADDDARCWATFVRAARDPEPAAALLASPRHWPPALLLAAFCARDWSGHPLGSVLAEQVILEGRILPEFRARAATALGETGEAWHAALLVDAVCGTQLDVRAAAVRGLSRLHERLGTHGSSGVPPVSEVLAVTLTRGYQWQVEGQSQLDAWLTEWARPRVELLIQALGPGELANRVFAARLLGQLCDLRAADALCRAARDANPELVEAATAGLIALGPALVAGGEQWVPLLVAALGHRPEPLTLFALNVLSKIGSSRAVDRVLHILSAAATDELRLPALYTLGRIGDRRAMAPLLRHLGDPADVVPLGAAKALARVISRLPNDESTVALLRPTLESGDPLVVGASLRKLTAVDTLSAAYLVAGALAGLDEFRQIQACMALRKLDRCEVLGTLLQFLAAPPREPGAEVVRQAVQTACSLLRQYRGATDAQVDLIITALRCPHVEVARAAAHVAWTCSDTRLDVHLLNACLRGDEALSQAAGSCFKRRICTPHLVWLTKILSDGDDRMARGAEAALVAIGNRAVGGLIKAVHWQYPRARLAAIRALGRIGNKRAVAVLRSACRDQDYRVRDLAAKALSTMQVPQM